MNRRRRHRRRSTVVVVAKKILRPSSWLEKNLGFLERSFKVFRFLGFFRFHCTNKTGHEISTQEERPIILYTIHSLLF